MSECLIFLLYESQCCWIKTCFSFKGSWNFNSKVVTIVCILSLCKWFLCLQESCHLSISVVADGVMSVGEELFDAVCLNLNSYTKRKRELYLNVGSALGDRKLQASTVEPKQDIILIFIVPLWSKCILPWNHACVPDKVLVDRSNDGVDWNKAKKYLWSG